MQITIYLCCGLKYFVVILVFAGIILENCSKSLIVMQYWSNQAFIAQNLCENKNRPEMHCNGKCHLRKELEKDTQQEKNNSGKESYEVMFVNELQTFMQTPPVAATIKHTIFYKDPYLPTPVFAIFHPPQWYSC
ncbi:hypothetical protein ACE38W_07720 [Chitinophaga sp. Hz27]|uniref:hypothetical protein n=1 Tax=Chitinophaga sp. Hz27 TaxID=3347169 RepID=UPI0035D68B7D